MNTIYLDNAATTPLSPEVIKAMTQVLAENYGNPSSTHQLGRKAKALVEQVRKDIAKQFKVSAGEIFFTAGGTEADNTVSVRKHGGEDLGTFTIEEFIALINEEISKTLVSF